MRNASRLFAASRLPRLTYAASEPLVDCAGRPCGTSEAQSGQYEKGLDLNPGSRSAEASCNDRAISANPALQAVCIDRKCSCNEHFALQGKFGRLGGNERVEL